MTFLATSGIFREETIQEDGVAAAAAAEPRYHLTTASRLLIDDDDVARGASRTCISHLLTLCSSPSYFTASQNLAEWLKEDDGGAAADAVRDGAWRGFLRRRPPRRGVRRVLRQGDGLGPGAEPGDGPCGPWPTHPNPINLLTILIQCTKRYFFSTSATASDSRFVSEIVVREYGEVLAGVRSVVDVGGHNGMTARAIAEAFPHVKCSVLELPRVVDAMPADDGTVEFVAGDMREFIPPADAVLFKCVLHNWSDEDCVQILRRSKEAVSTREPKGKVVITEVVLGRYPSKQTLEAQLLMDLCMMVVLEGKERTEEACHKIFLDAGFTRYKITPISGTTRSLIEVFP